MEGITLLGAIKLGFGLTFGVALACFSLVASGIVLGAGRVLVKAFRTGLERALSSSR